MAIVNVLDAVKISTPRSSPLRPVDPTDVLVVDGVQRIHWWRIHVQKVKRISQSKSKQCMDLEHRTLCALALNWSPLWSPLTLAALLHLESTHTGCTSALGAHSHWLHFCTWSPLTLAALGAHSHWLHLEPGAHSHWPLLEPTHTGCTWSPEPTHTGHSGSR
jgi:hypothetical protein